MKKYKNIMTQIINEKYESDDETSYDDETSCDDETSSIETYLETEKIIDSEAFFQDFISSANLLRYINSLIVYHSDLITKSN